MIVTESVESSQLKQAATPWLQLDKLETKIQHKLQLFYPNLKLIMDNVLLITGFMSCLLFYCLQVLKIPIKLIVKYDRFFVWCFLIYGQIFFALMYLVFIPYNLKRPNLM